MPEKRLLAVDPSLTCSGWALFSLPRGKLLAVGKIRSKGCSFSLQYRLKDLQEKIGEVFEMLQLSHNDVLICEAPTTMRDPRAAFKVEQVRGIFEAVARARYLSVPGRINPRSVQSEIMGLRGKQLERTVVKGVAQKTVKALYGSVLNSMGFETSLVSLKRNQDIVDAILIGSLGVTRVSTATVAGAVLEEVFEPRYNRGRRRLSR